MRRTSRVERLARTEEKRVIKRVFFLSVISLVLIVLIFKFGIGALGRFTDVLTTILGKKTTQTTDTSALVSPRFDPLPQATNSATLAVSGFSEGVKVQIFLAGNKVGEANTDNGKFKYENLTLQSGTNNIKAKTVNSSGRESDFSQDLLITLNTTAPKLEVNTPDDGQSFSGNNRIKVTGKTDPNSQVYANGFLATVGTDGTFEVFVTLVGGENNIQIKALDDAGNTTTVSKKVNFNK